ncbi:uncharacterized protein [Physcomitrium patens]|uniref:uncharacterized protein isoform X2 n=1 Tax=Physcomitrium patens TaxID=3218 RepID=UPI000D17C21F|nr:uncharacterized protein LOC112284635 isoform X2 [Physcomitrium patens]|eukprot:XP_024380396.1 uncharacterized protein LOC112284635 isoform X2 [Physcomitrella patens]
MEVYTVSSEERRIRVPARSRERARASVLQLLLLSLGLVVLTMCLRFFFNAHLQPSLNHVAQERLLCTRGQSKQWCCGHRGARTLAPENTMAAFLTALKVGANCIEMDVHRTSDGKIAVVHANHYRNKILPANGHVGDAAIRVEDTSWDVLRKLDAGAWFDKKYENERIPQLATVLETFWDVDVRLIVELKAEKCLSLNSIQCQRHCNWEEHYANSLKASLFRVQKDHGVGRPRFSLLFTSFNHSLVDQLDSLAETNDPASSLTSGYLLDPHFNYTGADFKDGVTWLGPHFSKVGEVANLWQNSFVFPLGSRTLVKL